MKTYVRIDSGKVAELFQTAGDITTMFHPSLIWIDVGASSPAVGWSYGAGVFSAPVATPVAQVQAAQWDKIKSERDRRQSGGYLVASKWYHSDDGSRIQQLGLLMMGASIPANLQWKTMDGTFVTMTQTLAGQVFSAAAASDQAIFAKAEAHKAAMIAATDPSTYDFSTGWPAVFTG
jgi:hypothetical protein